MPARLGHIPSPCRPRPRPASRLVARKTYSPLLDHLGKRLKREVVLLFPSVGEASVLDGMRTGQVHIGQFATGGTMYAVNFADAVPFAGKGARRAPSSRN